MLVSHCYKDLLPELLHFDCLSTHCYCSLRIGKGSSLHRNWQQSNYNHDKTAAIEFLQREISMTDMI